MTGSKLLGLVLGVVFGLLLMTLVWLTLVILVGVGGYLWDARPLVLVFVVAGVVAFGWWTLGRLRPSPAPLATSGLPEVHPGIRIHAIPVAGGIGLVFTLGYLGMFWFGLPGAQPVVLAAVALGLACGVLLVWRTTHRYAHVIDARVLRLADAARDSRPADPRKVDHDPRDGHRAG